MILGKFVPDDSTVVLILQVFAPRYRILVIIGFSFPVPLKVSRERLYLGLVCFPHCCLSKEFTTQIQVCMVIIVKYTPMLLKCLIIAYNMISKLSSVIGKLFTAYMELDS